MDNSYNSYDERKFSYTDNSYNNSDKSNVSYNSYNNGNESNTEINEKSLKEFMENHKAFRDTQDLTENEVEKQKKIEDLIKKLKKKQNGKEIVDNLFSTEDGVYLFTGTTLTNKIQKYLKNARIIILENFTEFGIDDCKKLKEIYTLKATKLVIKNCENLRDIHAPYVENFHIQNCKSIEEIFLSKAIKTDIGDCANLKKVELKEDNDDGAFAIYNCHNLKEVKVKNTGKVKIKNCKNLEIVCAENKVTNGIIINNCPNVKVLNLHPYNNISCNGSDKTEEYKELCNKLFSTEDGVYLFTGTTLTNDIKQDIKNARIIILPNFTEFSIDDCEKLKEIYTPKATKLVIKNCESLIGIHAPYVENFRIKNCKSIEEIFLSKAIETDIGDCANLKKVELKEGNDDGAFIIYNCPNLEEVKVKDTGKVKIDDCKNLEKVCAEKKVTNGITINNCPNVGVLNLHPFNKIYCNGSDKTEGYKKLRSKLEALNKTSNRCWSTIAGLQSLKYMKNPEKFLSVGGMYNHNVNSYISNSTFEKLSNVEQKKKIVQSDIKNLISQDNNAEKTQYKKR